MLVDQKIIDDKIHLDFKYKIFSGPSEVKNYGIALARTIRLPSSIIDRADELIGSIEDESVLPLILDKESTKETTTDVVDDTMNETSKTINETTQEIDGLEKDVIDLYSYVLLLMSTDKEKRFEHISIEIINEKLRELISTMSPQLCELLKESSLDEIIGILNSSRSFS